MHEPSISRRTFQVVALATLPLPFLATYALGRHAAALVPDDSSTATLLTLLAHLLVLLGCVVVWAVLLLPLRRRAGFQPLAEELEDIRRAGGIRQAVAVERQALEARATAGDPSYHATFALVGLLLALAAAGLSWALWSDGYVVTLALAAVVVCPLLSLHHFMRWLRLR